MTSQERILLALQHKEADRIAIQDGPWETTIRRWHKEGLPKNESPFNYFKYEMINVRADLSFRLSGQTIEDTDEYTIVKDDVSFEQYKRVIELVHEYGKY